MALDLEAKNPMYINNGQYDYDHLDLSQLDIEVDVPNIADYPNEEYALLRKHGLGTSDASAIVGVNPYVTYDELIAEKSRNFLTPDEIEVGSKPAVRKGRDLEPMVIDKFSKIIGKRIIKPADMYHHKEHTWLKFNYDGVIDKQNIGDGRYQYIPSEIKVVTLYGVKHYDQTKAWYRETVGFTDIPQNYAVSNNSIETKAALYGIPPYYYTQLQQEIYGLNAPYGLLTVLFDKTWEVVSFYVHRDDNTINSVLINGYKAWQKICTLTGEPNRQDLSGLLKKE